MPWYSCELPAEQYPLWNPQRAIDIAFPDIQIPIAVDIYQVIRRPNIGLYFDEIYHAINTILVDGFFVLLDDRDLWF